MPGPTRAQKKLAEWEYRVAAMGTFEMNEDYNVSDVLDKHIRFTGFLEERIARMIKLEHPISPFFEFDIERKKFDEYWWDTAIEIADGNEARSALLKIKNVTAAEKQIVYGELIPAYRALKDSFEKRWWFEWLTNHKQYTAERDSIKALKGVMMALTGDEAEDIDNELEQHRASVRTSGVNPKERKAVIKEVKEKRIHEIKRLKVTKWIVEKRERGNLPENLMCFDPDYQIDGEIKNSEWGKIYREIMEEPIIDKNDALEIIEDGFNIDDEISEDGEVLEDGEARKSDNVIQDNIIFEEGEEEINLAIEENENEIEREKLLFEDDELEKINASFEVPRHAEDNDISFQEELRSPFDLLSK